MGFSSGLVSSFTPFLSQSPETQDDLVRNTEQSDRRYSEAQVRQVSTWRITNAVTYALWSFHSSKGGKHEGIDITVAGMYIELVADIIAVYKLLCRF